MDKRKAELQVLPEEVRDRITEFRKVRGGDIESHPGNWRDHPDLQVRAMYGILKEVGNAGVLMCWFSQRNGGKLTTYDGHLRKGMGPNVMWWCAITDFTDEEADYSLATHDPLTAMARADAGVLDALLSSVQSGEAAVQQMLADLAKAVTIPGSDEWGAAFGGLPDEDRAPFQQMTFTLHDEQVDKVKAAISAASKIGKFDDSPNKNGNGNALAFICETFVTAYGQS